jgi:hypothetical protein
MFTTEKWPYRQSSWYIRNRKVIREACKMSAVSRKSSMETKKCVKVFIKITNNHEIEYLVRNKVAIVIHDEKLASSNPRSGYR